MQGDVGQFAQCPPRTEHELRLEGGSDILGHAGER
jgi:hypothetical protein